MFLGRGIKGNRVIGATDEKQFQVSINPQSLVLLVIAVVLQNRANRKKPPKT
ncbi:MAG: hypothetical protein L0211_17270 [Planctomycetaceae bacterium]|nr:hypothetical protein [Planctomycetaceae bacterium]